MTKIIAKYSLRLTEHQYVEVPKGAEILTIEILKQSTLPPEQLVLCAMQEKVQEMDVPLTKRDIIILGPGVEINHTETLRYIKSVVWLNDILHIFEGVDVERYESREEAKESTSSG